MTLKRIIFRFCVRGLEKLCLWHSPKHCNRSNFDLSELPADQRHTDIITIAFNNADIIPIHVRKIEEYCKLGGEMTHIIADNSSDVEISSKIQHYCEANKIPYIRLPKNHLNLVGSSYSHAAALNWVYHHIISKRKPAFFGITDHDLFPIKSIGIVDILRRQHIYGPLRKRGNSWYLSAILSFFDYQYIQNKHVDFMPIQGKDGVYLDTGGGNWPGIYSKMRIEDITFCSERLENITEGDDRHTNMLEFFDNQWLHTINGSHWKNPSDEKDSLIEEVVEKYCAIAVKEQ